MRDRIICIPTVTLLVLLLLPMVYNIIIIQYCIITRSVWTTMTTTAAAAAVYGYLIIVSRFIQYNIIMDSMIRRRSYTVWRRHKYIIYVWRRKNDGDARYDNRRVPSHMVVIGKLTSTLNSESERYREADFCACACKL